MANAFVGAASGTNTAALPAGWAPGDVALVFAFRDGSTTAPTLPAGWTQVSTGSGSSCSQRVGRRVLAAGDTTIGTWTNATSVVCLVYTGCDATTPIGATAQTGSASTTITYPALTLQVATGSSWVVGFAGHRSVDTALETAPQGAVTRIGVLDATDEAVGVDTNGGVTTAPLRNVAVGGTSLGWRSVTVELRGAPSAHPLADQVAGQPDLSERHRIKAQALVALANMDGRSVTRGLWTATVVGAPTLVNGLLAFALRIEHSGVDVTPADLNPVRVYNPPILVPDPAGDVVRESVDGVRTISRFREDALTAFLDIIRGLIPAGA